MKKLLIIALIVTMAICLCACGNLAASEFVRAIYKKVEVVKCLQKEI